MSFTEKIDVLDLLIQILNEHEKKLDLITSRLEAILEQAEPALPSEELEEDQGTPSPESSKYLEDHR